jgi:hypothetical protein
MAAAEIPENLRVSSQRQHRKIPAGTPRTHVKKHPLDMAAKQRAVRAMQLREEGMTYDTIAGELGFSGRSAVYNAIDRELDRMAQHSVENLRKSEGSRLDRLDAIAIPKALKGDLWALDRVLNIQARRAKLYGLDMDRGELLAAMPYQKRIILDDGGDTPLPSPARQPLLTSVADTDTSL